MGKLSTQAQGAWLWSCPFLFLGDIWVNTDVVLLRLLCFLGGLCHTHHCQSTSLKCLTTSTEQETACGRMFLISQPAQRRVGALQKGLGRGNRTTVPHLILFFFPLQKTTFINYTQCPPRCLPKGHGNSHVTLSTPLPGCGP